MAAERHIETISALRGIGALDLAARNGLKKVAIINQDALLPKAVANTTNELAKNKSLDVVAFETYPTGTKDFSAILKNGAGCCSGSIDRSGRPAGRSRGNHPGDEKNQPRYEDGEQSALRSAAGVLSAAREGC
jgi:hypothetical protein